MSHPTACASRKKYPLSATESPSGGAERLEPVSIHAIDLVTSSDLDG